MKRRVLYLFGSCFCALALLASPLPAIADGVGLFDDLETTPVIITELQTGATSAGEEFVELYNQSDDTVDIAGWQVRYVNSSTTTGITSLLATITPTAGDSLLLEPGKYFVLHTASVTVPVTSQAQTFSAKLSSGDKTVALFERDEMTCEMVVHDALAWEAAPGTTVGEGLGVVVGASQVSKEKLLQRYRNAAGRYVDTNHNSQDFTLSTTYSTASPGTDNLALFTGVPAEVGDSSPLASFAAPDCTPPEEPEPEPPVVDPPTEPSPPSVEDPPTSDPDPEPEKPSIPSANLGLKSPQLSELLPNPGSPLTDANDEFIELYNPNDKQFDLHGYILEVGTTSKRRYTFAAGTKLAAKSFVAYFSSDTKLALSNSGGQVRLLDPLGRVLAESQPYVTAKDNQSWLLANGQWQWSTKPTPNALNVVSAPETKKKASETKKATVKSASTEKSSTNKDNADSQDDPQAVGSTSTPGTPLHPGVLALVVGSAILYGAYEYRHDVANKIRQFRNYRATRRSNRSSA